MIKPKKQNLISRSIFMKVCEQNKQMRKDIIILIGETTLEQMKVIKKWKQKFGM